MIVVIAEHVPLLERLAAGTLRAHSDDARVRWLVELELAGVVEEDGEGAFALTPAGRRLVALLRRATRLPAELPEGARERWGPVEVPQPQPVEDWPEGYRWCGSEVAAAVAAARRAGRVGPVAEALLFDRGLALRARDRESGAERVILSAAGEELAALLDGLRPRLSVDADLARRIRELPQGPATSDRLSTGGFDEHRLEIMGLIAYGVPGSRTFAFTAAGRAVRETLLRAGFGEGVVLDDPILDDLAALAEGRELPEERLLELEALGYVGGEGELLPGGRWALEARRLLRGQAPGRAPTFAVEAEEVEVLETVAQLWERTAADPEAVPTFDRLRREMIERKVREYRAVLERYGRRLNELPELRRRIAEAFAGAKDLARWYDGNFELRESLLALESFDLLRSETDGDGREVFRLTPHGEAVLREQAHRRRDVTATAVKAITLPRHAAHAPADPWYEAARAEALVGTAGPSEAGSFYAGLAEGVVRRPHLSVREAEILRRIPGRGATVEEIHAALDGSFGAERVRWALEKLEARGLVDVQVDGTVVETEVGAMLDRALSGVPPGVAVPVDPLVVRVLAALRQVGTLHVKERKVRIEPEAWREAKRLSGLSGEAFENALERLRAAGLVGRSGINEAGLLVLEAAERLARPQPAADPGV